MRQALSGTGTVAGQEFRARLRTGRWRWLLAAWFLVVTVFMVLLRVALGATPLATAAQGQLGVPMFGGLMLWVLALALLVTPALSAQAVNGDRERGTLATLQVTRLSAAEIAGGKLLASWGTSAVFLALTLPHVAWSIVAGGISVVRAVVVLAVVLLLCGVVCATALALSALLARGTTSAVLSYCVVFALTVGTLVVFGLGTALTTETVQRTMRVPAAPRLETVPPGSDAGSAEPRRFETRTYTTTRSHPERVWWALAPNPFVVLADAAPQLSPRRDPVTDQLQPRAFDPLGVIGRLVRRTRVPDQPPTARPYPPPSEPGSHQRPRELAVWPWGLGFDVLLGAAAFAVTVRRLRTPTHRLPKGVRIA